MIKNSLTVLILCCLLLRTAAAATPPTLITNGGFENLNATGQLADWSPYEQGYAVDSDVHHGGSHSIRCMNASPADKHAAVFVAVLNQTRPIPVQIAGWSKAQDVGGGADNDYSIYVDVQYTDGSFLYGQTAPFHVGTHDWQHGRLTVLPVKPIKQLRIYALFRGHSGTVWFDDFSGEIRDGGFDGQAIAPPHLAAGITRGWFIRDVAADSPTTVFVANRAMQTHLANEISEAAGQVVRATVVNDANHPRAVTVYYIERLAGMPTADAVWWNDVRDPRQTEGKGEWSNVTRVPGVGANESLSLYPWGCVTAGKTGRSLGLPPDLGPRIARIGYSAGDRLLYVAFDVALPAHDDRSRAPVRVAVARYDIDPEWGFRAAAATYYRLFPAAFVRRTKTEGIWMPFVDPSKVPHVEDFGIAFHEGDNSVASDDRLGILSFHYTEPMTYWQSLPKSVPRTYAAAMDAIHRDAASQSDSLAHRSAQALLTSGTEDANGSFNVQFQDTPWADGAVWVLNPNPRLPHSPDLWTKARLNYPASEQARYAPSAAGGVLDGEYLDSVESWADCLDFRPESLKATSLPLTFTSDTYQPVLPTWFSVYEYAAYLSRDLHSRGKLLMANTVLARFHAFAPLMDVMGIETNWGAGAAFNPDSDAVFNYRRTMADQKPYLLLQNTDFSKFGSAEVEKYFQRCLFYDVYPSMFSADASNNIYWETPRLYERDRALFRRYIPIIRRLSQAGWEPITYAKSSNPDVYVERYGEEFTVMNSTDHPVQTVLTIYAAALWRLHGSAKSKADNVVIKIALQAGETRVISGPLTLHP